MANKPNDFFATLMFQPNTTFEDMAAEGLTADNLGLQSRDYYKDIQQVKDTFVDKNGKFDNKAYDNFYDNCLSLYKVTFIFGCPTASFIKFSYFASSGSASFSKI